MRKAMANPSPQARATGHQSTMRVVRWGVVFFFLLVLFDGALRKWVAPSFSTPLFVLKDVVLAGTLGVYMVERGLQLPLTLRRSILSVLLSAFAFWCALEAFNLSLPTPILGVWGFKLHVLYISLVFLIPASFRSFDQMYRYVWWYAVLSVPVLVLGIVQFYSPPSSFINTYVSQSAGNVARFGTERYARITGTFSYIAGMGRYIFFAPLLSLMLLAGERMRLNWRTLPLWGSLSVGGVVIPMNGSRWPVFAFGIVALIIVFFVRQIRRVAPRVLSPWRLVLMGGIVGVALVAYGMPATTALEERITESDDTERRIEERLFEPFDLIAEAGLFGYGVGSTYQAASVLVGGASGDWGPPGYYEEAPERLMIELGVIGFILQYSLYAALCFYIYRVARILGEPRRLFLAIGALSFILVHLTEQVAFNVTAAAFFWGFVGVAVAIGEEIGA